MGYTATTGVILCWNPDKTFVIHRAHHIFLEKYNAHLSIEDNHNPGSLLLQQDHGSLLQNLDLHELIPCEIDITPTPFCDTKNLTYGIELPPSGNRIGFNLFYDEYFTIPYVIYTIPNSPDGHQLKTQAKKNV